MDSRDTRTQSDAGNDALQVAWQGCGRHGERRNPKAAPGDDAAAEIGARLAARRTLTLAMASVLTACGGGGGGGEQVGAGGATATLSWSAVAGDSTLAGYRVYYGVAPGSYFQARSNGLEVGNVTTYTLTGLSGATTYYFAVTAYDWALNESAFSNEAVKVLP
jgi:hypothetical protein